MKSSHVYVIKQGILADNVDVETNVSIFYDYVKARKKLLLMVRKINNRFYSDQQHKLDYIYQEAQPDLFVNNKGYLKITAHEVK